MPLVLRLSVGWFVRSAVARSAWCFIGVRQFMATYHLNMIHQSHRQRLPRYGSSGFAGCDPCPPRQSFMAHWSSASMNTCCPQ